MANAPLRAGPDLPWLCEHQLRLAGPRMEFQTVFFLSAVLCAHSGWKIDLTRRVPISGDPCIG